MNLLIVAATEFEIEPLLKENILADILVTGVGIPATVFHLGKKLLEKKYDFVIQAGIGGTFNDGFKLSEVVLVKEDTFGDLGIEENNNFYSLFEKGFAGQNAFPFTNGWLVNNSSVFQKIDLPIAKAITVNKIGDNQLHNRIMQKKFSAHVESMEGAAFHYVCLYEKINFLQVRSLSNQVGERDKSKWQLKKAIGNLNNELIKIIEKL
ncbi:MAG TPA: futalosine hydrolase [Hanamia sp.]|nr:futalosine hydrolase [Hanamia sp.]